MDAQEFTCKNCGQIFTGNYCNNCGEKRYTEHDRHIAHFFEEGFHFITHFEGKFFKTIRTILTHPGKLSEDYCTGIRKSYFKPLSLFLLLVVIYLLFPMFEGLNMKLYYHVNHGTYGKFAEHEVQKVLTKTGMTMEELSKAFHTKSEKVSKFLLVVILPLLAFTLWPVTFRKRPYFFDQMVFSTEINSIFLIWGFLLLPVLFGLTEYIFHAVSKHPFYVQEDLVGMIMYTGVGIYFAIAARRFYRIKVWQSIILSVVFIFIHVLIIQLVYKFILFVTVIKQIH